MSAFKYLFSQYFYYSKNFTKLLAAVLIKCDSDYFRAKLSMNLWEEGGGEQIDQRHSEIFRKFLEQSLSIDIKDIHFENCTTTYFNDYLSLCLDSKPG